MTRTLAHWWPTEWAGISLQWKPRDFRIGACWGTWPVYGAEPAMITEIWIYLLPCLPINVTWERPARGAGP